MRNCNTPYDDVFRTLLIDCKNLIIPVVNEIFKEDYTGNEKIVLKENEIFLRQQHGEEEKRITDSSFDIVSIGEEHARQYHIECQSTSDGSMLIRMYEYDSQMALKNGEVENGILNVHFPDSAIVYLRKSKNILSNMKICIHTSGGSVDYKIPVLNVTDYDIKTIFKKKLLFLLPFHIFTYEENLEEFEKSEEKRQKLREIYSNIVKRLEKLCMSGEIDEYTRLTICEMTEKVVKHLANGQKKVQKEVVEIMGGKVLDHTAKRIYQHGKIEEAQENALEFFKNGASFEMVEKSIKTLTHDELVEIYNRAGMSE